MPPSLLSCSPVISFDPELNRHSEQFVRIMQVVVACLGPNKVTCRLYKGYTKPTWL